MMKQNTAKRKFLLMQVDKQPAKMECVPNMEEVLKNTLSLYYLKFKNGHDLAIVEVDSNLYLGVFGPDAMLGYVHDPGGNNSAVGHRCWLLYPLIQQMGTGDIPPASNHSAANAHWVFDLPRSYPATRDTFVVWPPPGYVPYSLIFPAGLSPCAMLPSHPLR
jgi:hypothetical protein